MQIERISCVCPACWGKGARGGSQQESCKLCGGSGKSFIERVTIPERQGKYRFPEPSKWRRG